jgi:hypothetical protein
VLSIPELLCSFVSRWTPLSVFGLTPGLACYSRQALVGNLARDPALGLDSFEFC